MIGRVLLLSGLLLLAALSVGGASAHYTPLPGDQFTYNEAIALSNGVGNYSRYTESTSINGSLSVTSVLPNGTESVSFYNANSYQNNTGGSQTWNSSGKFTFSATTFLYVNGTDNQTGYTNPYVWFFMNNQLPEGASFYVLNSGLSVVSTSYNYALETAAGTYVKAIFAEGNDSYQRNDAYGVFSASYNWKAYFDPLTGYILGYVYTEQDSDNAGDGFTITDTLSVTHTSYALTPGSAPPASSSGTGSSTSNLLLIVAVLVIVVVIIVVVVVAVSGSRRNHPLPRHSATGRMTFSPPLGPPPPGIQLTPSGQPAVQQIIIKETVKVNCRYCGALIDSTVEKCPFCGAART
ncbi:MAG: zinc ribbon domain-containing protein [Thermoplasmata archaeon]